MKTTKNILLAAGVLTGILAAFACNTDELSELDKQKGELVKMVAATEKYLEVEKIFAPVHCCVR